MTPKTARPTPAHAAVIAAGAYLLFVIVVPLAIVTVGLAVNGPALGVAFAIANAYLLAIVAGPLAAARGRVGKPNLNAAAQTLLSSDLEVVRLHDLVRHPRDPAGTGVALLRAAIRDPRFASVTIVTTAVHPRLAAAYEAAGMTPVRRTTTLTRPPRARQTAGAA